MTNTTNWFSIIAILGLAWIMAGDKTSKPLTNTSRAPVIERLTPQNLPKYLVTQLIIQAILEQVVPSKEYEDKFASSPDDNPDSSPNDKTETLPLPFTPSIPVNSEGNFSIEIECYQGEQANECLERAYRDSSNSAFTDIHNIVKSNIDSYNKKKEKFEADYELCDEKVISSGADLSDTMLTYDLQLHCMIIAGHYETLLQLSQRSPRLLKNRLDNLDSNKEFLSQYINN